MPRTISIVGAGRVGKTLGKCLHRVGWRIGAVVARSDAHAKAAVRWIGAGMPRGRVTGDVFDADVILLATPDDVLEQVAARLARIGWQSVQRKCVLHTSGALDSSVLTPLARLGAATGSLHPMQTFTGREVPKLKGVIFAVEGDPAARRVAQRIARAVRRRSGHNRREEQGRLSRRWRTRCGPCAGAHRSGHANPHAIGLHASPRHASSTTIDAPDAR